MNWEIWGWCILDGRRKFATISTDFLNLFRIYSEFFFLASDLNEKSDEVKDCDCLNGSSLGILA